MSSKNILTRLLSTRKCNGKASQSTDNTTLTRSQSHHPARTDQLAVQTITKRASTISGTGTAISLSRPSTPLYVANPDPVSDNESSIHNDQCQANESMMPITSDNLSIETDSVYGSESSSSIDTIEDDRALSSEEVAGSTSVPKAPPPPIERDADAMLTVPNLVPLPDIASGRLSLTGYSHFLYTSPRDSLATNRTTMTSNAKSHQSQLFSSQRSRTDSMPSMMTTKSMATLAKHQSKYSKISHSLTSNAEETLKSYRKMVKANNDPALQFEYAKYLLDIVKLYDTHREEFPQLELIKSDKAEKNMKKKLEREGVRCIRELADNGHRESAHLVATWYENGCYGFKKSNSKAERHHLLAAKNESPESLFALGIRLEGQGRDLEALNMYKKASKMDMKEAKYKTAQLYIRHEKGKEEEIVQLLVDATQMGCEESPYLLALLLGGHHLNMTLPGELIEQFGGNMAAFHFFEIAAIRGHIDAYYCLGRIFELGRYRMKVDLKRSFECYHAAALNHHVKAMVRLSRLFVAHRSIPGEDDLMVDDESWLLDCFHLSNPEEEAHFWCSNALERDPNNKQTCFLLGWYYEVGIGAPRDLKRAKKCYHLAHQLGHDLAANRINMIQSWDSTTKAKVHPNNKTCQPMVHALTI